MFVFIGFQTDMHVRDKVLMLIGSWCEAFGGSRGKYPQYYMAYEELRVNILAHYPVSIASNLIFTALLIWC